MAEQDAGQIAQQAAQAAEQAAQQARQTAQDIAQSVQDVKSAAQAVQEASRGVGAETSGATIETDISPASIGDAWRANLKRSYDEYQDVSLTAARFGMRLAERIAMDSLDHSNRLKIIAEKQLSDAANHAVDLQTQTITHNDLAKDRIWNVDEVSQLAAKTPIYLDALAEALVVALAKSQSDK